MSLASPIPAEFSPAFVGCGISIPNSPPTSQEVRSQTQNKAFVGSVTPPPFPKILWWILLQPALWIVVDLRLESQKPLRFTIHKYTGGPPPTHLGLNPFPSTPLEGFPVSLIPVPSANAYAITPHACERRAWPSGLATGQGLWQTGFYSQFCC